MTIEQVYRVMEPDLYDFLHDFFNRFRDELDYFYKHPMKSTVNRTELENDLLMKDWEASQKLLRENPERAKNITDMRALTTDTFTILTFFQWLQGECGRSQMDRIYIVGKISHGKYHADIEAFSFKQPLFLSYDRYKYNLMWEAKPYYGTIESLICQW